MLETIGYMDSPVGCLKLVQADAAISTLHFISESEYVGAAGVFSTPLLRECATQLARYFEGDLIKFDFPIAQHGTDFQQRVWAQLETIPFGKTISYYQLAVKLGDAKCIRAAGTANGRNNLAIVVPCHRVVGADGSLTGYAGGLWRKQWLLEHEAKWAHGVQTLF
ncbi:MAG: methylated-DNA--[protein]-cysteine S-methyltransferase [Chitinophagaceae bacterium]